MSHFERLSDGTCVYKVQDATFAYYFCCHAADGPMRKWVTLEFDHGRCHFSDRLMRRPAPDNETLTAWAREVHIHTGVEDPNNYLYPPYIGHILDLIYSGNGQLVDEYSRMAFVPTGNATREDFLLLLMSNLRRSPYWADLLRLNGGHLQYAQKD